ncbi:acetylornithine transaminase [Halalkalibacterium ligniniphilum]|uniref:acetylornithine transaminase n=1 Tax=Halalkalibacterium ligniniphilum TaxID=1134413 RepID=UPI000348195A|nr:acetylornithine transaminase [Halalkalibacterium ligniniphilum]
MSHLFPTYGKWDIEIKSGSGAFVVDSNGKSYLDFIAGIAVCNLGHCHPKVINAVKEQLDTLWHISNLSPIQGQEDVAKKLTENHTGDYVFFCNSGTEANEAAIKLARKATGKHHIISLVNSFHGRTLGSMAATGQEKIHAGFGPMLSTFDYVPLNDIHALQAAVNEETAAIVVEVIQGEGGVHVMAQSFADGLQALCEEKGILLIIDEIQTGIGRTGKAYAYEHYGLSPDIVTLAKGLGNGFPVGAMIGKAHLKESFSAGSHGSTFGGNPLAMAAAKVVLTEIFNEEFLDEVAKKGKTFKAKLRDTLLDYSMVQEIRGIGLMIGIECNTDVTAIVKALRDKGLLVMNAGSKVIRLLPPLTVTNEELEQALQLLSEVFQELETKQTLTK